MSCELPNGWEAIKLEDIASWGSGGTPPRKNPKFYGGDIPWIKTGELGEGLILDTEEKITADGLKNSSAKVFPKGSVAIAMYGATIGKVSILGIDAATNQACAVGIPDLRLTGPQYIFQYLRSQKEAFIAAGKGGAQPNLSQGVIKEWPFPLAPLAEQNRIADKLEAVLGRVDACRARLNRVPALLKRFRQSVLAAATSGKLTEIWRVTKKLEPWTSRPLDELCEKSRVITYGVIKLGDETPKGVPCLRTSNVRWLNIDITGMKKIAMELSNEYPRTILKGGEVLVNVRGTLGGVAVAGEEMKGWNVSREVAVVPVETRSLCPRFLAFWIGAESSQAWLTGVQKGVAYTGINIEDLRRLPVGVPSPEEQQEIVRRVEALFAFADRIESRLATAQKTFERLTPATLAKAFRGELVPQDPNDEPAAVLLARLKASPNKAATKPILRRMAKRTR